MKQEPLATAGLHASPVRCTEGHTEVLLQEPVVTGSFYFDRDTRAYKATEPTFKTRTNRVTLVYSD